MVRFFLCFLLVMGWQRSFSAVNSEVICYVQYKPQSTRPVGLNFRIYFDDAINKYVGGMVAYSNSKTSIPIIFDSEESVEISKVGVTEYKRSWLEIFDGKITGRYIENGSDSGNQFGRSIDYINFRTQATVKFSFSSDACDLQ